MTADHLGSPRIISNENGVITDRKDYSAFGEESASSQRSGHAEYTRADGLRKGYTGYEKDDESGLDFAQARYYNASHGRYTSVDPLTASASIKNPQTFNRYSYVLNSPYKFVDPLGLISESTGACGSRCPGSGPRIDGSAFRGRDASFDWAQFAPPPPPPPPPGNYYISRDGTVRVEATQGTASSYFIELKDKPGEFLETPQFTLEHNAAGLVYFPDSDPGGAFERYSGKDVGGKNNGVNHGKGDHYLNGDVAAALFGVTVVLSESHGIKMSFGDMSADSGTDPWQKGSEDHKGHGHGDRSGLDIDFRYIDGNGGSFQGVMKDTRFSVSNNQLVFDIAAKFGFTENYQGTSAKLKGIKTAAGHNNHGHLGYGR